MKSGYTENRNYTNWIGPMVINNYALRLIVIYLEQKYSEGFR